MNPFEIAIRFVRSTGPVTLDQIASELRIQATIPDGHSPQTLAEGAVKHGLETGWLEVYDQEEKGEFSYCLKS